MEARRVWRSLNVRGEGAVVAGFDTGVVYQHPALIDKYRGSETEGFNHNYNWFEPDSDLYPDGNLGPSVTSEPHDGDLFSTHGTHTVGTMVSGDSFDAQSGDMIGMAPAAQWIAVPGICSATMSRNLGDDIGGLKAYQ